MVFSTTATQNKETISDNSKDLEIQSPPQDGISDLHWSPVADHLAATSWDNHVRLWEVNTMGNSIPRAAFSMDAPALSCRWTKDGTKIVAAGADKSAKLFDIQTQQVQMVAQHDAPIKAVRWFEENMRVLMTGSWDRTLKYWDLRSPGPVATLHLGERVYTMDTFGPYLMCGLADRKIQVMHLSNPSVIYKTMESPLKWQTRVIRCFLNAGSMAIGSLDGRIAIHHVEDKFKVENFTFKCHRDDASPQNVYAVNDVAVHPNYGTFATSGSDGAIHFWDKEARTRLKTFQHAGNGVPIPCISFNRLGGMLAYAVSYDWSRGHEHYNLGAPNTIKLHAVNDADIRSRPKKR